MKTRLDQLKEFLEKEPDDPFLNYALAMETESAGDRQRALDILRTLRNTHPDYTATYYHLGRLLLEFGKRDEALAIFEEGVKRTRAKKEQHLLAELQSALNNLLYDE
ncbi:MAG: tetratricopeptide repeat protein [Flavobacteriales bacterium]|nr:tetratricopeptide repeat protein [Flavobacteriales bacterium]